MYQEYAIDPTTICRSFDRFKMIWNGLGYGEGRLLSMLPASWAKKVVKSSAYNDLPDGLRKKAIEDNLAREKKLKQKSVASGRNYKPDLGSWLQGAEEAHADRPFHGILAETNPREQPAVTCFDDLGENEDCCWNLPRPWQVKRNHIAMANAAAPLLRCSKQILLIEPYFHFGRRFTRPLLSFLTELVPYTGSIDRVEVHLKHNPERGTPEYFTEEFKQEAAGKLRFIQPTGGESLLQKLEFFIWENPDDNRMHPRYILTEVAGLGFENGLDESDDGETLTDVNPVYGQSLETRWNEFQVGTAARQLLSKFSISDL
jgi:hypothetical protein